MEASLDLALGNRTRSVHVEFDGIVSVGNPGLDVPAPHDVVRRFIDAVAVGCFSPGCPRSLIVARVTGAESEARGDRSTWRADLEVGPTDLAAFGVLVRLATAALKPSSAPRLKLYERTDAPSRIEDLGRLGYPPTRLAFRNTAPVEAKSVTLLIEAAQPLGGDAADEIIRTVRGWAGVLLAFEPPPNVPPSLAAFGRLERILRHGERRVVATLSDVMTAASTWRAIACALDSLAGTAAVSSVEVVGS
jgi:hypothetical protein